MSVSQRVSVEDWVRVADQLARYCHHLDDGRADDVVALFTDDGVIDTGPPRQPVSGAAAIRGFVKMAYEHTGRGRMRHHLGDLYCDHDGGADVITASYYNFVSTWGDVGGVCQEMALSKATMVRQSDGWLIKRMEMTSASDNQRPGGER